MAIPASSSSTPELLALTAEIVAAHIAGNTLPADASPDLTRSVHAALAHVGAPNSTLQPQEPAVPIKRSVQPNYLICLEDRAKVRVLTRYLKQRFGLTRTPTVPNGGCQQTARRWPRPAPPSGRRWPDSSGWGRRRPPWPRLPIRGLNP